MSKTKAPLRITFAGGGTDLEPYISDYGSYVLSAAIKMYACVIYSLDYSPQTQMEQILSQMAGRGGLRIINDVYPMSGLGGSASCVVAGIKAIYPSLTKEQIARMGFFIERKIMSVAGGNQDYYCATYGNFLFLVSEGGNTEINELQMPPRLSRLLLLVYTSIRSMDGSDILKDQLTRYNVKALHRQKQIAKGMRDCVKQGDLVGFGKLMNEAWQCKKEFSPLVSNSNIDDFHTKALSLGAIAGQIMGAGGGGYMLLMEDPEKEGELRYNLTKQNIPYHNVEVDTDGVRELQ